MPAAAVTSANVTPVGAAAGPATSRSAAAVAVAVIRNPPLDPSRASAQSSIRDPQSAIRTDTDLPAACVRGSRSATLAARCKSAERHGFVIVDLLTLVVLLGFEQ